MISIGAHYRGPELDGSRIFKLISGATKVLMAQLGDDYAAHKNPAVNVVFYIPGSLGDFDIPKIEVSRFSRKQKLLLVAVPVPKEVVATGGSVEFFIGAMHKANAIAADVFAQKKVGAFDLAKAEGIVEKVRESLIVAGY